MKKLLSILMIGALSSTVLWAAVLISDDFNDTAGTSLDAHTCDTPASACWMEDSGDWDIQSNLTNGPAATANTIATADSGVADVTITVTLAVPNSGAYACGLIARFTNTGNYWLLLLERDDSGTPYIAVGERNAGSLVLRDQDNVSAGVTNSTQTMTATLSGTTISVTLDSVTSTWASASLNQTTTRHGLYWFTDISYTSCPHDNYSVEGTIGGSTPNRLLLLGVGEDTQGSARALPVDPLFVNPLDGRDAVRRAVLEERH